MLCAQCERRAEEVNFIDFIRKNVSWILAGGLLSFMSSYGQTFFISIFGGKIRDDFGPPMQSGGASMPWERAFLRL